MKSQTFAFSSITAKTRRGHSLGSCKTCQAQTSCIFPKWTPQGSEVDAGNLHSLHQGGQKVIGPYLFIKSVNAAPPCE